MGRLGPFVRESPAIRKFDRSLPADDPGVTRFRTSEWRPPIIARAWMNKFGKWKNAKNAGLI